MEETGYGSFMRMELRLEWLPYGEAGFKRRFYP